MVGSLDRYGTKSRKETLGEDHSFRQRDIRNYYIETLGDLLSNHQVQRYNVFGYEIHFYTLQTNEV